jgi:hypothetical protein
VEPINTFLIFAFPFLLLDTKSLMNEDETLTMTPGPIYESDWGDRSILYFSPRVY